ncbi:hypothetical protein Hamer_G020087 [Homarus americanus]|uniref:WAP domain-containing protein n=1 Tax=Homarus americanus TaxID=6706 RepID=A0A8J5JB66_HOMAM|nr:hypothetical protein Hamer_G020087 [Homarus americanus]
MFTLTFLLLSISLCLTGKSNPVRDENVAEAEIELGEEAPDIMGQGWSVVAQIDEDKPDTSVAVSGDLNGELLMQRSFEVPYRQERGDPKSLPVTTTDTPHSVLEQQGRASVVTGRGCNMIVQAMAQMCVIVVIVMAAMVCVAGFRVPLVPPPGPAPASNCQYWCRTPENRFYCCQHSGYCPATRAVCPITRKPLQDHLPRVDYNGVTFPDLPKFCATDGSCEGYEKCCFDRCFRRHVCKFAFSEDGPLTYSDEAGLQADVVQHTFAYDPHRFV